MSIKIIDNFLTKSYHKEILDLFNDSNFPWYYQSSITRANSKEDIIELESIGFSHIFIDKDGPRFTNYYYLILPYILKVKDLLDAGTILRCRSDMTLYSKNGYEHGYHLDFNQSNIATVYYVNDSDGDTIIKETQKRIKPKSNRLVIFDGNTLHTGCSPKQHKNRILINSNYVK
jgi:hypothetical protein